MLKLTFTLFAISLLTLACSNDNSSQVSTEPVPNDQVLALGQNNNNTAASDKGNIGTPVVTSTSVNLGEPFELEPGNEATVTGTDLGITFTKVISNSRCPGDVTCIWPGEATIGIIVTTTDASNHLSLKIDGLTGDLTGPTQHTVSYGGYRFTLLNLDPYPMEVPPDNPGPDRARLLITAE